MMRGSPPDKSLTALSPRMLQLRAARCPNSQIVLSREYFLFRQNTLHDDQLNVLATIATGQWRFDDAIARRLIISEGVALSLVCRTSAMELGNFSRIEILRNSVWLPDHRLVAYLDIENAVIIDGNGGVWQQLVVRKDRPSKAGSDLHRLVDAEEMANSSSLAVEESQ